MSDSGFLLQYWPILAVLNTTKTNKKNLDISHKRVVYIVPNYPGRTAKSKMAANKFRVKVTSWADVMWCRADAMAVRVAPCLAVPFGVVPWRQQRGFVSA